MCVHVCANGVGGGGGQCCGGAGQKPQPINHNAALPVCRASRGRAGRVCRRMARARLHCSSPAPSPCPPRIVKFVGVQVDVTNKTEGHSTTDQTGVPLLVKYDARLRDNVAAKIVSDVNTVRV